MNHSGHHDHANMHGGSSMTTADPHAGHHIMHHNMMNHSHTDHGSINHPTVEHGMKTYFHVSNEATILFYSWTTTTAVGMFGSCVAVIILSLLYEGLKVFRDRLFRKMELGRRKLYKKSALATVDNHFSVNEPLPTKSFSTSILSKDHIFQTLLHIIQMGLSYLLMLIFMTYNVWLCLAVITGSALGYFLFGWMKTRLTEVDEHCH